MERFTQRDLLMMILRNVIYSLVLMLTLTSGAQAQDAAPVKLATQARIDLWADAEVGEIAGGTFLAGSGHFERHNWRPAAEQSRGYTVFAPIVAHAWRSIEIEFTPKNSGKVEVALMGPWIEAAPKIRAKAEVDWVEVAGPQPLVWKGKPSQFLPSTNGTDLPAGTRILRAWHDERITTSINARAGVPVRLSFKVKAVLPPGMVENTRITSQETPAHRALQRFQKGANFGNWLEAPRGQDWGQHYTEADFINAKKEGFDHIRLPIAWQHYTGDGPEFTIERNMWKTVDEMVDLAEKHGLRLLINIHHFDAFTTNPAAQKPKFLKIWEQLAKHYAARSDDLAFELLNEPKDAATTDVLNPIYAETIALIRKMNPSRTLFIGPGQFNAVDQLPYLVLPANDTNLIVTVHSYDPFYFTHQATTFSSDDVKPLQGIQFPGPPDKPLAIPEGAKPYVKEWLERYNTLPTDQNPSSPKVLQSSVQRAKEWSDYYGRPIHYGEFGAYQAADDVSRANYYREFRQSIEQANFGWALWDWKAGFHYWDKTKDMPAPGMHEALFGK
ncbi:MAG: hypothetical protein C0478_14055 [Planctomyces sp.]|nr:hypothetical protein [Planctomyces sp.]